MALEGTLQDMSLSDLFQVFRMGPKTGILLLASTSDRGLIYVAQGRLIDAAIVRSPLRSVIAAQDEAVLQMLTWEEATFIFRHDEAVNQRTVRMKHDSEWLVMEGMRRRSDPSRVLPYHRIDLETRLQLSPIPSSAESGVSLDVTQWRILSQVTNCVNLRAICEITGIDAAMAIRTVTELLAIGLVEIVPPAPPRPEPRAARNARQSPRLDPALVGVGGESDDGLASAEQSPPVGRNLIDAIMRRIRGL